jgi:hypothetical protein
VTLHREGAREHAPWLVTVSDAVIDRPARNQAIETLRIVAAYAIIMYHSHAPLHDLAYAGLVVFVMLSPLVDYRYNFGAQRSIITLGRVFLIPWAAWMVIYALLNRLADRPMLPPGPVIAGIVYGTSPHLWFLPAMFVTLVALNMVKRRVSPEILFWGSVVLTAGALASVSLWRPVSLFWVPPLPQWVHAAPAVSAGIALGLMNRVRRRRWLAIMAMLVGLIVALASGLPGIGVPYAVGGGAVALTMISEHRHGERWMSRWRAPVAVQVISSCAMGIYLSHVIWLVIISRLTGAGTMLTVSLTFACALASVWLVRRVVPHSRLILG